MIEIEPKDAVAEDTEDALIFAELEEEYGSLPSPGTEIDVDYLNLLAGIMRKVGRKIDDLARMRNLEQSRIDDLFSSKVGPIEKQLKWLDSMYRPAFEKALAVANARGEKSIKLLYATVKRKPFTFAGSFVEGREAEAVEIARRSGAEEIIKPEKVIPELVGWGDFKKLCDFKVADGDQVTVVLKATGEVLEIVQAERHGGELEIKFG